MHLKFLNGGGQFEDTFLIILFKLLERSLDRSDILPSSLPDCFFCASSVFVMMVESVSDGKR